MASKPTTARPQPHRECPECGVVLPKSTSRGRARSFCSEPCKQAHNNRMGSRGKALAKIALGWRQARGSGDAGKLLFAEMTAMLDAWNSEDLKANRMKADDYAMMTLSGFTTPNYMDRRASTVRCSEGHQGCHEHSKTSMGVGPTVARTMARNQGWVINADGTGICPNCQD
jgi:endogenous inhibitor of DNA gyrase (YacG/DUF329 family)